MKNKLKAFIKDKWITIFNGKKSMKIKRNSNKGRLLESILNNPKGAQTELLELALNRKMAIPTLTTEEQKAKINEWQREEISKMANDQSRALAGLSNGKIYIEISEQGFKMVMPEELKEGFGVLVDMLNPEDKVRRMSIHQKEKVESLNKFFKLCGLDLYAKKDDEKLVFLGPDDVKLMQFMKTCIGYNIKHLGVF